MARAVYYDSNGHDYTDGVVCDGVDALKCYWRRVIDGEYQIIFRSIMPRNYFDTVCRIVMAGGNLAFIVDEVDMYFKNGDPGEAFGDVIRRGRHHDVELIGITQRPRQMGELRSMANVLYIFETHEPSDLAYFRQAFSEKLIEMIKRLKQYEYVRVPLPYDESTLEICKEAIESAANTRTNDCQIHQQPQPGEPVGLRQADGDPAGQTQ